MKMWFGILLFAISCQNTVPKAAPPTEKPKTQEKKLSILTPAKPQPISPENLPKVEIIPPLPTPEMIPGQTEVIVPPAILEQVEPVYPKLAREKGWEGISKVVVSVTADGKIEKIKLSGSSGFAALDQSALDAVKLWKFRAARRNSKPIAMDVTLKIGFILEK